MAKTGLTLAFSTLDPGFRVGFSSINGSGAQWIKDNLTYTTKNSKIIANVEPFGNGSSGTQKADFWTWITQNVTPGNSTPLRLSLQAVGKYYQTPQPWQTSNTDKSEYACRPSYTILTTDGFWNGGTPSSVGNVDGSTQTAITTPSNYQYQPIAPFSDGQSNTLADVAMQYWVTDLQPTINNEVPSTPSDPAYWQHMTTFTMGLGYTPAGITPNTLTQTQIFDWSRTGSPPSGVTSISWPSPASNSINNITDLMHAAVNGHGDFFSAKNPADFVNGIKSALAQIQDRKGAGNAITLSASSTTASADSVYRFIASYYTGQWTGSLTADTWSDATQTYSQAWSANSVFPSAANRNIWTVNRAASTTNTQSPVQFILGIGNTLPALDSPELNGLDYYVSSVKQSTTRAAMLNYLRGDNSDTNLRQRKAVLGDVISSTPVYVAAPDKTLFVNATFPGASTYAAFVAAKTNRTPLVYVAANDGMLHAFRVKQGTTNNILDANKPAGQEIFAYMPAGVLAQVANSPSGITNLANPQYGIVNGVTGAQAVPHQYFNDGRITTQSVYLDTGDGNGLIWRTILIGTTGRGPAKTVYAMDITNPANFESSTTTANNILWERSAGDAGACTGLITSGCSSYIGQMTGAPVIGQIKVGASNQWAVFIGNGYNSTANKPALLQFDLATGSLNVRATTGASNDGLAEPGLAQPDFKTGISTQAYAGDLNGNVWSFDLSSPTGTVTKIFQAKDANGAVQPITSLVSLDYDSKTSSTWAYFGTGRYLSNADVSSTQVQTWYGLRVATNATTTPLPAVVTASSTRANLTARTILAEVSASNGNFLRATSQASVGDMSGKLGWYLDLSTQAGERVINRTQFIGGLALVTTMIPKVSDPCNTVPSGAVMLVDPFTGGNFTSDIGLGSTSVTINNKNKIVPFNGMVYSVGPAAGVTGSYDKNGKIGLQFNNMSGSPVTLGPITAPGASAGRVSWRELSN
ncbi:MAG: PilC/PilY family type IV pilus protein [Thiomonas sp.]